MEPMTDYLKETIIREHLDGILLLLAEEYLRDWWVDRPEPQRLITRRFLGAHSLRHAHEIPDLTIALSSSTVRQVFLAVVAQSLTHTEG